MMTPRVRFRSSLTCALAGALGGTLLGGLPALAAQTVRATVDSRGTLRFSRATLKALGVRTSDGMVVVELPLPPRAVKKPARPPMAPVEPGAPHVHGSGDDHHAYDGPPRMFISVRPDGSLEIRKQKLPRIKTIIPGPPGTTFLATSEKGKLVLARPK